MGTKNIDFNIPINLKKRIAGNIIFTHNAAGGQSIVGDKYFILTDIAFVYFYDSGGIFGEPTLKKHNLQNHDLSINYHNNIVMIKELISENSFNVEIKETQDFFNKLSTAASNSHLNIYSLFHTDVTIESSSLFEITKTILELSGIGVNSEETMDDIASLGSDETWTYDINTTSTLNLSIEKKSDNLILNYHNHLVYKQPWSDLRISCIDNTINIIGNQKMLGWVVDSISIRFPENIGYEHFLNMFEKISANDSEDITETFKSSAAVHNISDNIFNEKTELRLGENYLEIANKHIELDKNINLIQGDVDSFYIGDNNGNIYHIEPFSKEFKKRVEENKTINIVARKCKKTGPYFLKDKESNHVKIEILNAEAISFTTDGKVKTLSFSEIKNIESNFGIGSKENDRNNTLTITTNDNKNLVFIGNIDTLAVVSLKINKYLYRKSASHAIEDTLNGTLKMESNYFKNVLFSPIIELHIYLEEIKKVDKKVSCKIPSVKNTEDALEIFNVFAKSIRNFISYYRNIQLYLSNQLLMNDIQLFFDNDDVPSNFSDQYLKWHSNCFYKLNYLNSPLANIEREVLSLENSLNIFSGRPQKFSSLGLSLGASLIHPAFLISSLQQGISIYQGSETAKDNKDTAIIGHVTRMIDNWNDLVGTVLPSLNQLLMNDIFDSRVELYNYINNYFTNNKNKGKLAEHLLERYFYTESLMKYPSTALGGLNISKNSINQRLDEISQQHNPFMFDQLQGA